MEPKEAEAALIALAAEVQRCVEASPLGQFLPPAEAATGGFGFVAFMNGGMMITIVSGPFNQLHAGIGSVASDGVPRTGRPRSSA